MEAAVSPGLRIPLSVQAALGTGARAPAGAWSPQCQSHDPVVCSLTGSACPAPRPLCPAPGPAGLQPNPFTVNHL